VVEPGRPVGPAGDEIPEGTSGSAAPLADQFVVLARLGTQITVNTVSAVSFCCFQRVIADATADDVLRAHVRIVSDRRRTVTIAIGSEVLAAIGLVAVC